VAKIARAHPGFSRGPPADAPPAARRRRWVRLRLFTSAVSAEVADVFTFVAIAARPGRRSAEPQRPPEATMVEALTRTAVAARARIA
jgi:hypothetical protein